MANQRQVLQSVLRYINQKTAIWQADSFNKYVYDAYLKNIDYASIVNFLAEKAALVGKKQEILEGNEWVEDEDKTLLELYQNPNPTQGQFEYETEAYSFFVITGNSYEVCEAPKAGLNKGKIKEMWNMPAHLTEVISGGWREPIAGYKIGFDHQMTIEVDKVIHMKRFNPKYQAGEFLQGLPKLASGAMALTSSNDGFNTKAALFQNGGVPGILSGEDDLTLKQEGWLANLLRRFSMPDKKGSVPYINTKLEYLKLGQDMVDLKVLESILNDKRSLCSLHQVSSRLFNDPEASTYNNIPADMKRAYLDAILPMVNHRLDEHTRYILPKFYDDGKQRRLVADTSGIEVLQDDMAKTAETINKLRGFLTYRMVYKMLNITPPDNFDNDLIDEIPTNMPTEQKPLQDELKKLGIQTGEYREDRA